MPHEAPQTDAVSLSNNPLLCDWLGPYQGVPPFDQVLNPHFEPALLQAMKECREEIQAIASNSAAPSFDNTVAALESSGRRLQQVRAVYSTWDWARSDSEFQKIARRLAPKLAAFEDEIVQNPQLFARIASVYRASTNPEKSAPLKPEQKRLTWHHYTRLVLAGAELDSTSQAQVAETNAQLASLFTQFSENVLAEESSHPVLLEREEELEGLSDSMKAEAATAAETHGFGGKWLIANTRSAVEPFLTSAVHRNARQKVWRNFVQRGDNGDTRDNSTLITEILQLRRRRAEILGYASHAHWRLNKSMAKTPEATLELMSTVWEAAVTRVAEEVTDMQALTPEPIEPWDYRYYAEKVRQKKYDLDEEEIKPYLQLDNLREAMFWVASQLFGLSFTPVDNVPVYHPDVRVWQVTRQTTGTDSTQPIGLWYFDPFAREGKRSGAWMSCLRNQQRLAGSVLPLVTNNENFLPPQPGSPCLLSWDNATTLFHEFGHGLHGLLSQVDSSSLAGTSVVRDFVEFPSQLFEHWLSAPEVLQRFALHVETGAPMPPTLLAKIAKASRFNQGFATVEYLATALVDMKMHLSTCDTIDPGVFERETLAELGMPKQIAMRHRPCHLTHVFAGDSYSAGYYSYLWADALTADAFEAFVEGEGAMDRALAKKLEKTVLRVGNTVDPADAYRAFRGKNPDAAALMRKRGFASEPQQ